MRCQKWFVAGALTFLAVLIVLLAVPRSSVEAGQLVHSGYNVLAPLTSGNLAIFPVVASSVHNTSIFLTLDEGLRSGEVVVTEAGSVQPLVRGRVHSRPYNGSAQVNTLVLINNSKRPLLLLAGEIVTGGKQDRVIGKDRIIPPESEPVDLGVFCVEPGRWVSKSENFGGFSNLAQPSVRANAMSKKDQQQVWDAVNESKAKVAQNVPAAAPQVNDTSSYATAMGGAVMRREYTKITAPLEKDYRSVIRDLKDRNAVGVVVAVNGEILWADIFASSDLLNRYWQKLVRSYAAEAISAGYGRGKVTEAEAQAFVDKLQGRHESAETEPGVYRHAEITGDDYKVFELTSLLPKTDFEVHIAKMYEEPKDVRMYRPAPLQR
ncbi:MAG: ARPP-1 family domain-containing protein [Terriglobales bacterium]